MKTKKNLKLKVVTLVSLISLLITTPSCKDDEVTLTEMQLLIRTWLFDDATGFADATDEFNFEQELNGFKLTFTVNPSSSFGDNGTYTYVAPNNSNDPSGSGTWQADGTQDNLIGIRLDPGTPDEQYYSVILISASQLNLEYTDSSLGTIQLYFVAN